MRGADRSSGLVDHLTSAYQAAMQVNYCQIMRLCSRPGWQETLRFVRFVSGAHSCYKHLPLVNTVPFVFASSRELVGAIVFWKAGEFVI